MNNEINTNEQVNQPVEQVVPVSPEVQVTQIPAEAPKKKGSNNVLLIVLLLIILLAGAGCAYYFLIVKQQKNDSNSTTTTTTSAIGETTTTTTTTTKTETQKETNDIDVIDIADYCINNQDCNKEIKDITLGDKTLKLSVDFKKFNIAGGGGDIILGDKKINFQQLTRNYQTNTLAAFGTYKDYLFVYAVDMDAQHTHITDESDCEVHEYTIYILDADLNEVGYIGGESQNSPMYDVKIDNNYVYFYQLNRTDNTGVTLQYFKVLFDKLLSKDNTSYEFISDVDTCRNMY